MLTSLLATEFDVVATASDGKSALDSVSLHNPDLLVLDLGMPVLGGMDVIKELAGTALPVVVCSMETDTDIVARVRKSGALGYVCKTNVGRDLTLAIKSALRGKPFVSLGRACCTTDELVR
jgi:DNA-binding NarL/FixJ family response regulator